jgi:hypothetical protein
MTKLEQNKVFQTLNGKLNSPKTSPGLKLGRLLDCKVALFLEKANYVISIPRLVPRGSCWTLVGTRKEIFDYESKEKQQRNKVL